MGHIFQNMGSLALAGMVLLAGALFLRWVLKFAWRMARVALILLSLILVASYFLGLLDVFIY
ncbi:MAG: hypothetical protein K0B06_07200 [Brevefilum sp.]|nr:hypothetical protein [Brevefilum sp.]